MVETNSNKLIFRTKSAIALAIMALGIASCGPPIPQKVFDDAATKRAAKSVNLITPTRRAKRTPVITPTLIPAPENTNLNPHFCVRADIPDLMAQAVELGGKYARIAQTYNQDGTPAFDLEKTIRAAENQGLIPLYVLSPTSLPEENSLRQQIKNLIDNHPTIIFELLNEPDNHYPADFWKDTPQNAGKFIQIAVDEIDKINTEKPIKTRIVLGAQKEIVNLSNFLSMLQSANVNLNKLEFSVHAYVINSNLGYIPNIMAIAKNTLKNHGMQNPIIWMTELGAEYTVQDRQSQNRLSDASQLALNNGISTICYHEIKEKIEGLYPTTYALYPDQFNILKNYIQSQPK